MERFTTVYAYDENGKFVGETVAQRDKKGRVLMPRNATDEVPPAEKEGFDAVFKDGAWSHVETPEPETEDDEPTAFEDLPYDAKRASRYPDVQEYLDAIVKIASGDPDLAAEGEVQKADYVQACLDVKAEFPKDGA